MDITIIGLALAGLASHWLTKIIGAKVEGSPGFGMAGFWTNNWPHTALSVIGTGALLVLAQNAPDVIGQLTPFSAYLAGFTGGSASGALGARTKA